MQLCQTCKLTRSVEASDTGAAEAANRIIQVQALARLRHLMICCCCCDWPDRKRSFSSPIALPSFRVGVGGASPALPPLPLTVPVFRSRSILSTCVPAALCACSIAVA